MTALDGISTLATTLGGLNGNLGISNVASTATAEAKPEKSGTPTVTDQANVSSAAGLVAQALNTSDVRMDKVTALQTAIASGSYSVPASEVAGKIVDSLLK
jgi:flagellar biosynthesis anti-sigma factor FlgM